MVAEPDPSGPQSQEEVVIGRIIGWVLIAVVVLGGVVLFGFRYVVPRATVDDLRGSVGLQAGAPERHLVPEDLRGWVRVEYGIPGEPPLETDDGTLVLRYPESGVLRTSSPANPGVKSQEYLSYGSSGTVPLARHGAERRIWGAFEMSSGVEDDRGEMRSERSSWFFVGTKDEHRDAKHVLPHELMGLPDLTERTERP